MLENASHIILHHRIENLPSWICMNMTCCIALIVVVSLVILVVILLASYALYQWRKRRRPKCRQMSSSGISLKSRDRITNVPSGNIIESTVASMQPDLTEGNESRMQNIPMENLKRCRAASDRCGGDSESSGGLYDVLFPSQHEGEIIYEPPKLVAFAGQVFASASGRSPKNSNFASSSSGAAQESLEWDYFHNKYTESDLSGLKPCTGDFGRIIDVCWV